jgi:hypothetical protein
MTKGDPRPFSQEEIDLLDPDGLLPESYLDQRIEGLEAIKNIINPHMSMATFFVRHRPNLDYILFIDKDNWRTNRPKFFTYRRLIYHYMLKTRVI